MRYISLLMLFPLSSLAGLQEEITIFTGNVLGDAQKNIQSRVRDKISGIVSQLQASLAQVQSEESGLEQNINALKDTLKAQEEQIQKLQNDLNHHVNPYEKTNQKG